MSDARYDLTVIGGGPAGYAAAIRAAQLGFETLCVDDRPSAGGTCLNVGCIPSKALLNSTERLARARSELERHGITLGEVGFDLDAMMARKDAVVEKLTKGIDQLLSKNGVERLQGRGELLGSGRLRVVNGGGDERTLRAEHILIATGSSPSVLPDLPEDERIFPSTRALALPRVPEHLAVIGGGYIGLELGSVWRRLGARVSVVELEDRVLPPMDAQLAEEAERSLEEQGIEFRLSRAVEDVRVDDDGAALVLREGNDGDETEELRCSHVLVAVGREPHTDGLGLDAAGVELTGEGFVRTDSRFRTTSPGIYAIGDVVGEPMLAHKGQLEGLACVEAIAGRGSGYVNYDAIPAVVFTWPEIASVGRTEDELREAGIRYRTGRASFRHDSRALCTGEATGFVKLLAEQGTDRLLGAHVIGPDAGALVHELVVAAELGGSVEELARCCHAHPTTNESVREAALALHGRAIHQ